MPCELPVKFTLSEYKVSESLTKLQILEPKPPSLPAIRYKVYCSKGLRKLQLQIRPAAAVLQPGPIRIEHRATDSGPTERHR